MSSSTKWGLREVSTFVAKNADELIGVLRKTDLSELDMLNQIIKILKKISKGSNETYDEVLDCIHRRVKMEMLEEKFNELMEHFEEQFNELKEHFPEDDKVIDCNEGSDAHGDNEDNPVGNDVGDTVTDEVEFDCDECCYIS